MYSIQCFIVFIFLFTLGPLHAQHADSAWAFQGYAESYYNYDFSKPLNQERAGFIYNHKRNNKLALNMAMAKMTFTASRLRSSVALMFGDYAAYNLAAEPSWAQCVYEANCGFRLLPQKGLYVDVGILPSHIGYETAIGADCWTLSRSIMAENSPYYEAGLRLSYSGTSRKAYFALLLLNGWQAIKWPKGIDYPALGVQATFKIANDFTFNYSNFYGAVQVNGIRARRLFHNFYCTYEQSKLWQAIAGFDFGSDWRAQMQNANWLAASLVLRRSLSVKSTVAARAEYYFDPSNTIIQADGFVGFKTASASANWDYKIQKALLFRLEFKRYWSMQQQFSGSAKASIISSAICWQLKN